MSVETDFQVQGVDMFANRRSVLIRLSQRIRVIVHGVYGIICNNSCNLKDV